MGQGFPLLQLFEECKLSRFLRRLDPKGVAGIKGQERKNVTVEFYPAAFASASLWGIITPVVGR